MLAILLSLIILFGWEVGALLGLSREWRIIASGALGYVTTTIFLQISWLFGVPFNLLVTLWLLVIAFISLFYYQQFLSDAVWIKGKILLIPTQIKSLLSMKLQPTIWPMLILLLPVLLSAVLMFLWPMTMYPTGWDNLAFYDALARMIEQGKNMPTILNEYAWDYYIRAYDLSHPPGMSLINALGYRFGVQMVDALALPVLFSAALIPLLLWLRWEQRMIWWILLFGSRYVLETALSGYSTWPYFLLWMMVAALLPLAIKKPIFLTTISLLLGGILTLRAEEPYWLILAIGSLFINQKRFGWQILPWLVFIQWWFVRFTLVSSLPLPIGPIPSVAGWVLPNWSVIKSMLFTIVEHIDFWSIVILWFVFFLINPKWRSAKINHFYLGFIAVNFLSIIAALLLWSSWHPEVAVDAVRAWPRATLPIIAIMIYQTVDRVHAMLKS